MIWKSSHAFCDGVSVMSLILALSHEYDKSYFISAKGLSWLKAVCVRLMMPLWIPALLIGMVF
jgi:hypothetical protein